VTVCFHGGNLKAPMRRNLGAASLISFDMVAEGAAGSVQAWAEGPGAGESWSEPPSRTQSESDIHYNRQSRLNKKSLSFPKYFKSTTGLG
jgi:hypothetical protein